MRVCERVFSVGFGPGLDSMSPARSRRSASHAAGTHGWPGLRRGGVGGYNLDSPPDGGTPTMLSMLEDARMRSGCNLSSILHC